MGILKNERPNRKKCPAHNGINPIILFMTCGLCKHFLPNLLSIFDEIQL